MSQNILFGRSPLPEKGFDCVLVQVFKTLLKQLGHATT
jgi:hypothetical protein